MTDSDDATAFAWHVHGALDSWTGKVDTKASIALAIESAMLGFAITLSQAGRPFADLSGRAETGYYVGLGFLLLSIALSLAVVLPQLNRWKSRKAAGAWQSNMIYFGHLRHWDPDQLAKALSRDPLPEKQLARQLVAMSRIAWRKHSFLQGSLVALSLGVAVLVAVAALH